MDTEGEYIFNFEVNASALKHIAHAFDKYIEKWPGGHPQEQEALKNIQLGLRKAVLDCQLIESQF